MQIAVVSTVIVKYHIMVAITDLQIGSKLKALILENNIGEKG